MAQSWTEVVNQGLIWASGKALTEITQSGAQAATLIEQLREPVLDAVLRAHPWNCAIELAGLPAISSKPVWGFPRQAELPTDPFCLRVVRLEDEDAKWRVRKRRLHTDAPTPINIEYIARVTDPAQLDALLTQAFAVRIGAQVVYRLTRSQTKARFLWDIYKDILHEARGVDGQEGSVEQLGADSFLEAML